jgi:hypothetical protein
MNPSFDDTITVIDRTKPRPRATKPSDHAKHEFLDVLTQKAETVDTVSHWSETGAQPPAIVIGKTTDPIIEKLLTESVQSPESIVIEWVTHPEGPFFVIAGTDERGLAYALYDIAEQIEANDISVLPSITSFIERPDNRIRGVDKFTMGPIVEDWLFDTNFWE